MNVLEAIKVVFDLNDAGDVTLNKISLIDLQTIYPTPKEGAYISTQGLFSNQPEACL